MPKWLDGTNPTIGESLKEFASLALLTNEMLEDKKVCRLHHGFWVRTMQERLEEAKNA
jgi:hypothetical protein